MQWKSLLNEKTIGIGLLLLGILMIVKGISDYGAIALLAGLIVLYFAGKVPVPDVRG